MTMCIEKFKLYNRFEENKGLSPLFFKVISNKNDRLCKLPISEEL